MRSFIASRLDRNRDDGYTLIELLVAMGIFTIVLSVIMGGVMVMTVDLRKTSNQTDASDQVRRAVLRMDKQVRYADSIAPPKKSGSDWYVAFETTASGQDNCQAYRLRGATDQLQYRKVDNDAGTDTGWQTVATNVVNDPAISAQQPFTLTVANGSTIIKQQLDVHLFASKGSSSTGTAETDVVFVARNSDVNSESTVCAGLLP
jgi:prepilin-type N-terminal cleavage/methylation domain-containing protein